jgi:hypothetical protein
MRAASLRRAIAGRHPSTAFTSALKIALSAANVASSGRGLPSLIDEACVGPHIVGFWLGTGWRAKALLQVSASSFVLAALRDCAGSEVLRRRIDEVKIVTIAITSKSCVSIPAMAPH